MLFTLVTTDWDLWEQAVKSVPTIVRESCRTLASMEYLRHPLGDLNKFWEGMIYSFR
jgi:hypothetical protein